MTSKYSPTLKFALVSGLLVLAIGLGWILGTSFKSDEQGADLSYQRYFNENYRIFSLNTPTQMTFGEERVPLEILDIREKLDRELLVNTYWQSQTLLFHKRANRWFPEIEAILKEEGVPEDFKYLAVIESGLTNVVSPAGATGFWQIMKRTGRDYGLEVNNEVDERYHVEKSTRAACSYLKEAYEKFGSWTMAAASYNMGKSGLSRQTDRQQVYNYYDLLLNEETGRYLYRILAAKEILNKPAQYGFHFRPQDLYPPYDTKVITIDQSVDNFAEFALDEGVNYKILKTLNPWLRDSFLTNSRGKTYEIKLPAGAESGLVPYELYAPTDSTTTDTIK